MAKRVLSEAAEKSVAINIERGLRAAAMCDMVNQTPLLPTKTPSDEVRAT